VTEFDAREFLDAFLAEATEHIRLAARLLLEIESAMAGGHQNRRAVREAYRAVHTIKGLAAMVGVDPIVDLSHAMESVLRSADSAGGPLEAQRVDLLLAGVRAIEDRLKALESGRKVESAPRDLVDALLESEIAGLAPGARATCPSRCP
jgi:two-component system chemotaxis sensor kinase CheA